MIALHSWFMIVHHVLRCVFSAMHCYAQHLTGMFAHVHGHGRARYALTFNHITICQGLHRGSSSAETASLMML